MAEKGLRPSNRNERKLMDEVEGMEPAKLKPYEDKKYEEIQPIPRKELKDIPSYKKGGIVKKTGLAKVHKGERVIPAKKETATERFIRVRNAKEAKGRR
ncbi:hypothetical protein M0Q28_06735 [Patescibacteria group bacterium]|jgi:hypothetical protein|nr:hypothetical protein [Patescibacteria group bacterium]